ncbi:nucleotidyltransferase domain-containing protein [Deltaproteobacteria bacterium TL4]
MKNEKEIRKICHDFSEALFRNIYGDNLCEVILYGSHARREATEDSDVDLLVVLKVRESRFSELEKMTPLAVEIMAKYQELLSLCPTTSEEWFTNNSSFFHNVKDEGEVVWKK